MACVSGRRLMLGRDGGPLYPVYYHGMYVCMHDCVLRTPARPLPLPPRPRVARARASSRADIVPGRYPWERQR